MTPDHGAETPGAARRQDHDERPAVVPPATRGAGSASVPQPGELESVALDLIIRHGVNVYPLERRDVSLFGFIAVADTVPELPERQLPWPPLGGCRRVSYPSLLAAGEDAVHLGQGMLMKSPQAGLELAGGKATLLHLGNLEGEQRRLYFEAVGEELARVNALRIAAGRIPYITSKDSGVTMDDLEAIREGSLRGNLPFVLQRTAESFAGSEDYRRMVLEPTKRLLDTCLECVVALPDTSGDPSPLTAWGAFHGMLAVISPHFGQDLPQIEPLKGLTISIKGVGAVGRPFARMCREAGATLNLADSFFGVSDSQLPEHLRAARESAYQELGIGTDPAVRIFPPEVLHEISADIYVSAALSGDITESNALDFDPRIRLVIPIANIPFESDQAKMILERRGTHTSYFPTINAGGVMNAAMDLEPGKYDPQVARDRVQQTVTSRCLELYAAVQANYAGANGGTFLNPRVIADQMTTRTLMEAAQ